MPDVQLIILMRTSTYLSTLFVAVVLFWSHHVYAALETDVSALTSKAAFSCLRKQGYRHVVLRAYMEAWGNHPGGKVDTHFVQNYRNAKAAGLSVDMYMFPCTGRSSCKSPATQVAETIQVMNKHRMQIGTIWFDVEVDRQARNWPSISSNRRTLVAFRNAWNRSRLNWGIYTSRSQWSAITGRSASWVLDASKPLWYAHYNNAPNFRDFTAFGGWKKPKVKQYAGDRSICGARVDLNYFK
ncbi:glycoside hydrolase superfamily [Absidia repens]|uniref:Glycoside hydrolase superfamily n=1 Tax=Absidia repens TaxID=90262 RepID=A0A1X2J016_9FUNG|nr:glycoside hydrolase superfamily [Absidia repens]